MEFVGQLLSLSPDFPSPFPLETAPAQLEAVLEGSEMGWNGRPGERKEHSIWVPLWAKSYMHVISCRPSAAL